MENKPTNNTEHAQYNADSTSNEERNDEIQKRTIQARSILHSLIVRFRKDADNAVDQEAKTIFEFSAEIIAGLTRGLREFQKRRLPDSEGKNEPDPPRK